MRIGQDGDVLGGGGALGSWGRPDLSDASGSKSRRLGMANALRALVAAEQQRGPDCLRLANALSALYPQDSEEKRLLNAMLLAVPRA